MAYGKDPKNLGTGGSFRQRANQYDHQKQQSRKRGGGGGGAYWATQFKPSLEDVDTIRVIEGRFSVPQIVGQGKDATLEMIELPFFPFAEHYDGQKRKTCICSAGPWAGSKEKADPCPACELFWSGMEKDQNGKRKQGRMSRREMYVFTVLDYGVYHNVPQTDFKTGEVRINEQTNKPWMHWVKCEGQGCQACRAGVETRRGATRHWALGWGHYQTLLDADKQIGKSCSNCRTSNSINCIAWLCPQCGDAVVDMATTTMKAKDIDELVSKPIKHGCGFEGMAHEMIECRACTNAGGTARRATIFDVDMNVKRVGDPNGGNQTSINISQWSVPGPVDPNFKDFAKSLDLPRVYTPTPPEKQCELFGITATQQPKERTPVTSGEASRPWGNQQPAAPAPNPYAAQQALPPPPPMAPPPQAPAFQQPSPWQQHLGPAGTGVLGLPLPPDSES